MSADEICTSLMDKLDNVRAVGFKVEVRSELPFILHICLLT